MSLFKWPFKRKQYPGLGNPRFVGDVVAANEAAIDAAKALTGLGNTDFAIISGLDFTPGAPGSYAPGIIYFNGSFYGVDTSFNENLYLIPNPTDIQPEPFSDGNQRNIYTLLGTQTSNVAGPSTTPQFVGDMNNYRISLKAITGALGVLQGLFNTLGNAAFRNVGTTAGTVAAGDDSRFGYTQAQIDSLFALKAKVILKDAGIAYTPAVATDPANKGYADQASCMRLRWLGDISGDASIVTKLGPSAPDALVVTAARLATGRYHINHNLGSINYFVSAIGIDTTALTVSPRSIQNKVANSFEIWTSDDASANDDSFEIAIIQFF